MKAWAVAFELVVATAQASTTYFAGTAVATTIATARTT